MKKIAFSMILLTGSTAFGDTQSDINQLQNQINALQQQVAGMNQTSFSKAVGTDTNAPFGAMSKTETPLAVLKARSSNSSSWVIGGQVESDLQYWNGSTLTSSSNKSYSDGTGVTLTKLYLFNQVNINQNAIGFISLKSTNPNYEVQVDRAFLILGQLDAQEPLFVTAGYTYLPFGNFGSNGPLNNNLTTNLYRVSPTDQISLNAGTGSLTFIGKAFNNNSSVNHTINYLITGLFAKTIEGYNLAIGSSYLTNIIGTNSGIGEAFHSGGSANSVSQPLQSNTNPAWDVNASFGITPLSLVGEYFTTLRAVNKQSQSVGKLSD